MLKKVFKYATEKQETEIRQTEKNKYQSTHDMLVEQASDLDSNFLGKMCGGTGSKIADVVIYDRETKEKLFNFPLRVLSMTEEQEVLIQALDEYNKLPELSRVPALLAMKQAYYRIYKAMTLEQGKDKHPVCGQTTFKQFTLRQIQMIHDKYEALCDIISPCLDSMSDAEIDHIVKEVVKKNFTVFTQCSRAQLENSLIYFSEIIQPLLTANASIGEP